MRSATDTGRTSKKVSKKDRSSVAQRTASTEEDEFLTPRVIDLILYLLETLVGIIICTLCASLLQLSVVIMLIFGTAMFSLMLGFSMVFASLFKTNTVSLFFNTLILAQLFLCYLIFSIMVFSKYSKSPLQLGRYMTIGGLGSTASVIHLAHCIATSATVRK